MRVGVDARSRETRDLDAAGGDHPLADGRRRLGGAGRPALPRRHPRHLEAQVDAVEQRTTQARAVLPQAKRRADALALAVAAVAAGARVHRRHEHEPRGIRHRRQAAADRHLAVLQRLAESLERGEPVLGELVQEEHAQVGEADLAGPRRASAADEPRRGDRVVRRPEGPPHHQRLARRQQAGHAVDAGDLDGLLARERRHDAGDPAREHGLAGARRTAHEHVVRARHGDLESALDQCLAHDVGEIGVAARRGRPAVRPGRTAETRASPPASICATASARFAAG